MATANKKSPLPYASFFQHRKEEILASLAFIAVFIIDVLSPLGIAIGALYIFCLFLVSKKQKRTIIFFAGLASFMTILKLILFMTNETSYMAVLNRGITILVIWLIAVLAIRHRLLIEKNNKERAIYIKDLEQMLFITNHKIRQPVTNCMGLMNVIDFTNPSKEDIGKIYSHVKTSAYNLDDFSKELNKFIADISENHRTRDWLQPL